MPASAKSTSYLPLVILLGLFCFGVVQASSGLVSIFQFGLNIAGVTSFELTYYFAGCAISVGILLASKTARSNRLAAAMSMSLYAFGLALIFFAGFSNMGPAPFESKLADSFAQLQAGAVRGAVWVIPVIVAGYLSVKALCSVRTEG